MIKCLKCEQEKECENKNYNIPKNVKSIHLLGNHMILSAIWDKSALVNISRTNKIFEKFEC